MQEKSIDEILLKNGFDILENGCCYTDKHRIERAMQEYGNQLVGDKERECDANHLNIDSLLQEFTRRGFNTENWDGDEGAEKAIVDGVCVYLEERQEKLFDTITEHHMKANEYKKEVEYWKARCEAAEDYFNAIDKWQTRKACSSDEQQQMRKKIFDASNKYEQLKQQPIK